MHAAKITCVALGFTKFTFCMKRELESEQMEHPFVETFKDVLAIIGSKCDILALKNFSSTCKGIHEVCNKESFFHDYFKSFYMPKSLCEKPLKDVWYSCHFLYSHNKAKRDFFASYYWAMPFVHCAVSFGIHPYVETTEAQKNSMKAVIPLLRGRAPALINLFR